MTPDQGYMFSPALFCNKELAVLDRNSPSVSRQFSSSDPLRCRKIVQTNGCCRSIAATSSNVRFHHNNPGFSTTWLLPEPFIIDTHAMNDRGLPLCSNFRATLELKI
ncbi:hypothetical protein CHARACLAT_031333 [Characodon lateralis]|uniref:Uncharacterized protein n=1 Tax=Characodon lateralis TaxID=208331 RepID=A0ABU7F7U5_9TELE|nr:hypothetical protein [Characodon lateralis]